MLTYNGIPPEFRGGVLLFIYLYGNNYSFSYSVESTGVEMVAATLSTSVAVGREPPSEL